jgi:hypothetical protein
MDETTRTELRAAHEAWTEAEAAYRDQAREHIDVSWVDDLPTDAVPVTRDALRELERLSSEARARREAYRDLLP